MTLEHPVRLWYEIFQRCASAANRPILFLHGFLGCRRENRAISRELAIDLNRPVYAVDLRNHGESGHHPKHDYVEMARDVENFLQVHSIKHPTLIGHSMGAKVALTVALRSRARISAAVAIDNCPIDLPLQPDFTRYLIQLQKLESANVTTHAEATEYLRETEPSASVRLWLLSNLVKKPDSNSLKLRIPAQVLLNSTGALGGFPFQPGKVQFPGPTLFLRALQSHYVPDEALPLIHSFFPKARVLDIDCGHWIVQERPQQCKQAIVEFLRKET